jgi:hypothetical protein
MIFPRADSFTCVGILLTNQCHKWAHMNEPPAFVRVLQKLRLVLRADEHRLHHRPPYDSHFCTASGWLNRPLTRCSNELPAAHRFWSAPG